MEDLDSLSDYQGDRWTFTAVIPKSGFIHTVHTGARNGEEAKQFVAKMKSKSDNCAPLIISDSWFYENALINNYCSYEPVVYKGRGRRPNPKQIIDKDLKYAQVCKQRNKSGKVTKITTRIVIGETASIKEILQKDGRSTTINTAFVENRNAKYRKDNVRLARQTMCHSKNAIYHDAHINFLTGVFNYCRENSSLKELINPNAGLFQKKYRRKSPAMGEGLTSKILSVKELLFCRVP